MTALLKPLSESLATPTAGPQIGLRTCRSFVRFFRNSRNHHARRPIDPQKVLRIFYRPDPQREHARRLLPGNRKVPGLVGARR